MGSLWVTVARIVIPLEGLLGMVLNIILIIYFVRSKLDGAARLYHISCIISAAISCYTAFLVTITVDVGDIIDGALVGAMYGPLLHYLSPIAVDVVAVAFFTQVHAIWQFVPAPSVLQWLSLSNRPMSNLARMVLAYVVPVACYTVAVITMIIVVPPAEMREEMTARAARRYNTSSSEFRVWAANLFDDNRISVADIAVYDFLPSFVACYSLYGFSAYKIWTELRSVGGRISAKTEQMQRRFFRLQIAQVTLPLVLPSIPMGVLILSIAFGTDLGGICFLFSYIMWPIPVFTALLLLGFVRNSNGGNNRKISKVLNKTSLTLS